MLAQDSHSQNLFEPWLSVHNDTKPLVEFENMSRFFGDIGLLVSA